MMFADGIPDVSWGDAGKGAGVAAGAGLIFYLANRVIGLWKEVKGTRNALREQQALTDDRIWRMFRSQYHEEFERLSGHIADQEKTIDRLEKEVDTLKIEGDRLRRDSLRPRVHAVVWANWDGIITSVCERIYEVLLWKAADLVGQSIEKVIPPEKRRQHRLAWARAKADRRTRPPDRPIRDFVLCGDGSVALAFIALRSFPEPDPDHGGQVLAEFFLQKSFTAFDVVSGSGQHTTLEVERRVESNPTPPPGTPERRETP